MVQNGVMKIVNYLFQPEMVPEGILPNLIEKTLNFLISGEDLVTTKRKVEPTLDLGEFLIPTGIFIAIVGAIGTVVYTRRIACNKDKSLSYWFKSKE